MSNPTPMSDTRGPWQRFTDYVLKNVLPMLIIPFGTAAVLMIVYVNNVSRDIVDIKQWQKDYSDTRTQKLQEIKEQNGKFDAQIGAVNARADRISEKVSGMDFQLTSAMANIKQLQDATDKISDSLNKLNSDVRLAVEILNRLDDKARRERTELTPPRTGGRGP